MKYLFAILLTVMLLTSCMDNLLVTTPQGRFSNVYVESHEVVEFERFKSTINPMLLKRRFPTFKGIGKVSITGWNNQHTDDIATAFLESYKEIVLLDFTGVVSGKEVVLEASNMSGAITPVIEFQEGYEALIHSYVSPVDYISRRVLNPNGDYYVDGLNKFFVFQAAGSNNFVHVNKYIAVEELTANHYVTGAGVEHNRTGYWLEFFDIDPIYGSTSSFSNGYIAGKVIAVYNLALLFDNDLTLEELKNVMIETSTREGDWDFYDGYGKVRSYCALWKLWKNRFN